MSLVWPNKDPDELLDYSIDWSDIVSGFTISTVVWSVRSNVNPAENTLVAGQDLTTASGGAIVDSIQNIQQALSGNNAIIYIGGGVNKRDYTFVCTITTSIATTIQRAVILRCRSV
jgi:hypothetical protein